MTRTGIADTADDLTHREGDAITGESMDEIVFFLLIVAIASVIGYWWTSIEALTWRLMTAPALLR